MKFKLSNKILEKYPELRVGFIVVKNLDNSSYNEEIQGLIRDVEKKTKELIDPEKVPEIPAVAKWREIYKSFGAKPSKYRNSVEALIKRVLKTELYKINSLVDIYNYISIKHTMTVGGEDLDNVEGELVLDFASGDEEFIALGSEENTPPWKGEVVYKDDKGVVCRCWNYREADRTKLTEKTKNAIIVIENIIPDRDEDLNKALEELKELVKRYCGGDIMVSILDKNTQEKEI